MGSDRKALLIFAAGTAALSALVFLAVRRSSPRAASAPASSAQTVALYMEGVRGAPEPLGLRVAEVRVETSGEARLVKWSDQTTADKIVAALAELRAQPILPASDERVEALPGAVKTELSGEDVRPGDPRYAWAVGGFLRQRTGLRYDVLR
jgi:hypothetical protein